MTYGATLGRHKQEIENLIRAAEQQLATTEDRVMYQQLNTLINQMRSSLHIINDTKSIATNVDAINNTTLESQLGW